MNKQDQPSATPVVSFKAFLVVMNLILLSVMLFQTQSGISSWMSQLSSDCAIVEEAKEEKTCELHLPLKKPNGKNDAAGPYRPRFTNETLRRYHDDAKNWEGWVSPQALFAMALTSKKQHEVGINGPVGEIGVHHGKFTVPIAMFGTRGDPIWAADLFEEMQDQNIDNSGMGNKKEFMKRLGNYDLLGEGGNDVTTIVESVNSLELHPSNFTAHGLEAFRMISVDGGHTHELTLNDLLLSCRLVKDGGVIMLDDIVRVDWLGVTSGYLSFMRSQDRFRPFFFGGNKMMLTTVDHVETYANAIRAINPALCDDVQAKTLFNRQIFPNMLCHLSCKDGQCASILSGEALFNLLPEQK